MLRDRARRRVLPTLRFLPRFAPQSMARHKLKNVLLLAARLLILLLLVLAFARPYLSRTAASEPTHAAGEALVFALDDSLSMRAGGRWAEATDRVAALCAGAPEGSPLALVLFDRVPRVACAPAPDAARLHESLRLSQPGMAGTDLIAGIRAAAELAARIPARRRIVYLLSDFQDSGMSQLVPEVELPGGVELVPLRIGGKTLPNAAVQALAELPATRPGRRTVRVQTISYGGDLEGELELMMDSRRLAAAPVKLAGGKPQVNEFELELPPADSALVTARLKLADALAEDNLGYLALPAQRPLPLLVTCRSGEVRIGAGPETTATVPAGVNPYLRAAVQACGTALAPRWIDPAALRADMARSYPVALVDQEGLDLAQAEEALLAYVRAGGVLIFFPATVSGGEGLQRLGGLSVEGQERLDPADGRYRLISSMATGGDFTLPGETGATLLGYPRAYRYFKVRGDGGPQLHTLLQLDDGRPFLLQRRLGQGAVYLFTAPLDPHCCDLVLRAAFSPFLFQLVRHGARATSPRTDYTVGESYTPDASVADQALTNPAGVVLPPGGTLDLAGVYRRGQGRLGQTVVVRLDPAESDLRPLDPARLALLTRSGPAARSAPAGTLATAPEETTPPPDARGRLWSLLLLGTMGLMASETLLASRTRR